MRFAAVLGVAPRELLGTEQRDDPISANQLASAIHEQCRARGITLDDLSKRAGWDISQAADAPQLLLADFTDGIRDICRALGLDWHRFVSGQTAAA